MRRINNRTMKRANIQMVLDTIRKKGPISRADLAKELGLTSPAVTNIVADLQKKELITEIGMSRISHGRSPILLDLNPEAAYVIGVVLMTEAVTIIVGDFKASMIYREDMPIDPLLGKDAIMSIIKAMIRKALTSSKLAEKQILCIGVSAPGPLDTRTGVIISPPNFPDWKNVHITEELSRTFGIPAVLDKETNAAALAEYYFRDLSDDVIFYILLLTNSIGGSVVKGGQIQHGFEDGSGDIGHMTIDINGRKCVCGQNGCLEAVASGKALVQRAQNMILRLKERKIPYSFDDTGITIETVFNYANKGIPVFTDTTDYAARAIAAAIGNVISILSPSMFIMAGAMLEFDPAFIERIRMYVRRRTYPSSVPDVRIVPSILGTDCVTAGSLILALNAVESKLYLE